MIGFLIGIIASLIFIYPVFQGLILLPLDLLVCNFSPWLLASQILIKNSYMVDSITQMYPWRHMTFSSLTNGSIPLWNPYQFMGMPFMAGLKSMVFYPLNILFLLGEIPAWNVLMFFQLFFAFFFCYLFMRIIHVSVWGSMLSSIAFAFSSMMIGFLQFGSDGHTLVWLPFLLFCVYAFLEKKKILYLIGLGIGTACAVFAGHLQFVGYECSLVLALVFYMSYLKRTTRKDVAMVLFAIGMGFGIAAVQLIPSIELFSQSARGMGYARSLFAEGLLRPYELFRIFSPDMFGHPSSGDLHTGYIESGGYFGLIPLFFVIFSFTKWKTNLWVRFFGIVGIVASVFSLWPFGLLFLAMRIPLITSGLGQRLFFLALFSGAVLSGFGLDSAVNDFKKAYKWILFYICALLLFFVGAFFINKYVVFFGGTIRNLKFSIIIIISFFLVTLVYRFLQKKFHFPLWVFVLAILFFSYADLFRMGYRFLTFSNEKFMYPNLPVTQFVRNLSTKSLDRVYGLAVSEIPSYLQVPSIETYNPLYPLRTGMVLKALEGKEGIDFPVNVYRFNYGEQLKYVLDVLGVSYVVTGKDQDPSIAFLGSPLFQNDFVKIYSDERHDVYRNTRAYPRFGLFYQVKSGLSENEIFEDIRYKTTDLRNTILLEDNLELKLSIGTGSAQLIESDNNSQIFSVTSDEPAIFYISDTYFPGWYASINGNSTRIYRANYNFRAVVIPKGESTVKFWYEPRSYIIGKYMSIGSCILLAVLGFVNNNMRMSSKVKAKKKINHLK